MVFHKDERKSLFRYIPVKLRGKGNILNAFAFIDESSSCTLIEDELASLVDLDGRKEELCLQRTGDIIQRYENSRILALELSSQENNAQREMFAQYLLFNYRPNLC